MVASQQSDSAMLGGENRDEEARMLAFVSEWWISIGALASLLLQISLLLTGGTRKWNRACRLVAWSSYNMSDFVATLVLGGLAQTAAQSGKTIYAVWAPVLLLHLGAPDNISAYSAEDAELWQRHGLTMLLQIVSAAYVVANCATTWRYSLVSLCLLAAGSIKSAERTLALRCASKSALKESALPIYEFMRLEPWLGRDATTAAAAAPPLHDASQTQSASAPNNAPPHTYHYLLKGEHQWHHNFLLLSARYDGPEDEDDVRGREAARLSPHLVTLHDVLSSPDLSHTPRVVLMCIGFSLFKLYRRRLSSLYMYEWRQRDKTPRFFLGDQIFASVRQLVFVLDVELRFLFDSLYTKAAGTAFTELGVMFRIGTTILLLVSGIFLLSPAMKLQEQAVAVKEAPGITFLLLAAAITVEAYQLMRLATSDWTKVWLACTYVRLKQTIERQSRVYPNCGFKIVMKIWAAMGILEMIRMGDSIARHKYWNDRIGQYCMRGEIHVSGRDYDRDSDTTNNDGQQRVRIGDMLYSMWQNVIIDSKVGRWILLHRPHLLGWLIQPRYEYDPRTLDDFKHYVLLRVLDSCRSWPSSQVMTLSMERIQQLHKRLPEAHRACLVAALGDGYTDIEHILVNWHVATCICEVLDSSPFSSHQTPDDHTMDLAHDPNFHPDPRAADPSPASSTLREEEDDDDNDDDDDDDAHTSSLMPATTEPLPAAWSRRAWTYHTNSHGIRLYDYSNGLDSSGRRRSRMDDREEEEEESLYASDTSNYNHLTEREELERDHDDDGSSGNRGAEAVVRRMSKLLSRYMAYVLVHKTELLPCHAHMGRQLAAETQRALGCKWDREHVSRLLLLPPRDAAAGAAPHQVQAGAHAARKLLEIPDAEERWRLILTLWVEILIFAAAANSKSAEHLHQLTLGGEFLTNIWVLLGHMGSGEK